MCSYATDWCSYLGGRQALQELVVHLALNCSTGGDHIFMLLLDAAEDPYALMSSNALEILGKYSSCVDAVVVSKNHVSFKLKYYK